MNKEKRRGWLLLAIFIAIIVITSRFLPTDQPQEQLVTINNINENIEIVGDSIITHLPLGINLEYAGQISQDSFFVIYNNKGYMTNHVFCWIGSRDSLIECSVLMAFQRQSPGERSITIVDTNGIYNGLFQGKISYFTFPHPSTREVNTFNQRELLNCYP